MKSISNKFSFSILTALAILFATGFINPAYAVTVDFDNPNGYVLGHGARITVTDPGNTAPDITVIVSEIDSGGVTIETRDYIFTGSNGVYTHPAGYLMFKSPTDDTNFDVAVGNTVRVSFSGVDSSRIILTQNAAGMPPPLTAQPNQPYTIKINCSTNGGDADGDFICDNFETDVGLRIPYTAYGVTAEFFWPCTTDPDGPWQVPPLDHPCPSPQRKDVYVEADWMQNHAPDRTAIQTVKDAFDDAPTLAVDGCTLSTCTGIALHFLLNEEVPHKQAINGPNNGGDTTDYTRYKKAHFGDSTEREVPAGQTGQWVKNMLTAKRHAFHYMFIAHDHTTGTSGRSEAATVAPFGAANDMGVYLGSWANAVGSPDDQAGTIMHELGHNLGLDHGGPLATSQPTINCKPNYLSVMSWSRQFSDLYTGVVRPVDYSHEAPGISGGINLVENALDENLGVTSRSGQHTVYGSSSGTVSLPVPAEGQINWDMNSFPPPENPAAASAIANIPDIGCSNPSTELTLGAHNDWNNLMFNMAASSSWLDGVNIVPGRDGLTTEMWILIIFLIILIIILVILIIWLWRRQ